MGDRKIGYIDHDTIEPFRIEHKVDEIIIDGQLEQVYNFIDYWFESSAGPVRARSYVDASGKVALYPSSGPGGALVYPRDDPETREKIIAYFARRYLVIQELDLSGYETTWMALNARRHLQHLGLWESGSQVDDQPIVIS